LALKAVNKGRPLALDGGGKLGEAFRTIAHDLGGIRMERQDAVKATGSGLFGLITGRR
jgi:hypothetical protein